MSNSETSNFFVAQTRGERSSAEKEPFLDGHELKWRNLMEVADRRKKMGVEGRAFALYHFDRRKIAEDFVEPIRNDFRK